MLRIGVLVSGGGTNLQAVIDAIDAGRIKNAEIAAVVSSKAGVYALERARLRGIENAVISKKSFADSERYDVTLADYFNERGCGLVILAGFLTIFGEKFLTKFKGRVINVHPSLIPSFCGKGFYGLKPHEAALARGVKVTGATVHFVTAGVDEGPIIAQKAVLVKDGDTAETLQRRVMEEAEWVILPEAVRKIVNCEL